jgi:hypothetical protein
MAWSVDLFTGIGGFAVALKGIATPVLYCESDPLVRRALVGIMDRGRLPKAPIVEDVRDIAGIQKVVGGRRIDVLTAGFPCVGFSKRGYREIRRSGSEGVGRSSCRRSSCRRSTRRRSTRRRSTRRRSTRRRSTCRRSTRRRSTRRRSTRRRSSRRRSSRSRSSRRRSTRRRSTCRSTCRSTRRRSRRCYRSSCRRSSCRVCLGAR